MSAHLEAERLILGEILRKPQSYDLISDMLVPRMFSTDMHLDIFATMMDLNLNGRNITRAAVAFSLGDTVANQSTDSTLSALTYEAESAGDVPIRQYAEAVVARFKTESLKKILTTAPKKEMSTDDRIADLLSQFTELQGTGQIVQTVPISTAALQVIDMIADAHKRGKGVGIDCGVPFVESLTGPWFPGNLIAIGGGTKQGKSALAQQCMTGIARNYRVLCFSFEMSPLEMAQRELAKRTKISTNRQMEGNVNAHEFDHLNAAAEEMQQHRNLEILSSNMTISQVEQRVRREHKLRPLGAVFIDYLTLVDSDPDDRAKAGWEKGELFTLRFKRLATELQIPIVILCQLKKNAQRTDGGNLKAKITSAYTRPRFTDLVGAVERDCHHVIMPFRPEVFLAEMEPLNTSEDYPAWQTAMDRERGKAQIVLALSRTRRWPQVREIKFSGEKTEFEEHEPIPETML